MNEQMHRDIELLGLHFRLYQWGAETLAAWQRIRASLEQPPPAAVPCPNLTPTGECIKARMAAQQAYVAGTEAPPAAAPDREAVARGMYEAEMRRRGLETCWETKSSVIKSGWYGVADDAIAAMLAAAQATKGVE